MAHIESLPRQAVSDTRGGFELAPRARRAPSRGGGAAVAGLLDLLFDRAVPPSFNTASPGYLAYIPGGGLFQSAVADLIADSINRYTSVYAAAPALAQLEANVDRLVLPDRRLSAPRPGGRSPAAARSPTSRPW